MIHCLVLYSTRILVRAEVAAELAALARVQVEPPSTSLGEAQKGLTPQKFYASHPEEVEVPLDGARTLIWSPTCWHATECQQKQQQQQQQQQRRAISWNYGKRADTSDGARVRDAAAVRYVFAGEWEAWPEARQKLWGLWEEPTTTVVARL